MRIAQLIKDNFGEMLLNESGIPSDILISVVRVDVSPDMQWADVLLQVYPMTSGEEIVEWLRGKVYDLQQELNQRVNIRHTPKLRFSLDRGPEKQQKVEEKLKEARKYGEGLE